MISSLICLAITLTFFGFLNAEKKRELPPHIIQKFDEDGDGQLSDAEKETAKAARKARKGR